MITFRIWEDMRYEDEPFEFFMAVLLTLIALPIDIILLPVELLSLLIWKINEHRKTKKKIAKKIKEK